MHCSQVPKTRKRAQTHTKPSVSLAKIQVKEGRREIVVHALSLLGTSYLFGGKHPQVGLDCSGIVRFIYKNALNIDLPHNVLQIAKIAKVIPRTQLQAGDFVFFNTLNRPYSHMGIYLGDNKFIHAPSSQGKVKVSNLDNPYFAACFEAAATIL